MAERTEVKLRGDLMNFFLDTGIIEPGGDAAAQDRNLVYRATESPIRADYGKKAAEIHSNQLQIQDLLREFEQSEDDLRLSLREALCPVDTLRYGVVIVSRYGWRKSSGTAHTGVDISGGGQPPIRAVMRGVVRKIGWDDDGYGRYVIIDHGPYKDKGLMFTLYAHMEPESANHLSVGGAVRRGQQIGVMGNSGHSEGVHLHFEVWRGGFGFQTYTVNPRNVLPAIKALGLKGDTVTEYDDYASIKKP